MSNDKRPERLAVEQAIRRAIEPVTADDIAKKTGLHEDTVRSHLNNCLSHGLVRNLRPGRKPACYVWKDGPEPERARVNEPRSCLTLGTYKPPKGAPPRDGSLDFLDKPTVRNGVAFPWALPMILASSALSLPKST